MTARNTIAELRFDTPVAVIGDIHGHADLLAALLDALGDVPVLVVGDVCDRGPRTREVIDLLVGRGARGVYGNHDEWLARWARGDGFDKFALSPAMGGLATLESYGVRSASTVYIESAWRSVPREHARWLDSLALVGDLTVRGEDYWLVHAGVPWGSAQLVPEGEALVPWLALHRPHDLLWPLTAPEDVERADRTIVMGHKSVPEPVDHGHVIAVDTGAGLPGRALTAVLLPERRFVSVAPAAT